jgi:hypothetical protein
MGVFQTSYSQRPAEACIGDLAEAFAPGRRVARIARGLIKAGYGAFAVPTVGTAGTSMLDPGEVFQIANPVVAADVDAIVTAITSSLAVQSFSGATLNGAVGATEMQPARQVTLVLSNHADWDATNATLVGINHLGQSVTETLAIPNGGNATVTSANTYRSVTSLSVPAQSGVGGTATVGIAALTSGLVAADFRGVALRQKIKSTIATLGIYPGIPGVTSTTVTADYVDGDQVPMVEQGGIWVFTEEAVVDGDPVYVRIASGAGGSQIGAFRNDADTASCVLVPDARFVRNASAGCAWAYFPHRG